MSSVFVLYRKALAYEKFNDSDEKNCSCVCVCLNSLKSLWKGINSDAIFNLFYQNDQQTCSVYQMNNCDIMTMTVMIIVIVIIIILYVKCML